jgi:hypothetical protein
MNLFMILMVGIGREGGKDTIAVGGDKDGPRNVLFLDSIVDCGFEVGHVDSGLLYGAIKGLQFSYVLKSSLTNRKVRNKSESQFITHQTVRAVCTQSI